MYLLWEVPLKVFDSSDVWESSVVGISAPSGQIKGNVPVSIAVCLFNNSVPVKVMDLWVHVFQQTPVLGIGVRLICSLARRVFDLQTQLSNAYCDFWWTIYSSVLYVICIHSCRYYLLQKCRIKTSKNEVNIFFFLSYCLFLTNSVFLRGKKLQKPYKLHEELV